MLRAIMLSAFSFQLSALILLCACASEDVSDGGATGLQQESDAIGFRLTAGAQTRATDVDLETVAKDFRVFGVNGKFDGGTFVEANKVMDNYVVWWNDGSGGTTSTNDRDWEYVGSYAGGDDALRSPEFGEDEKTRIAKQSVKYWDYGQPYHIFYGVATAANGTFSHDETTHQTTATMTLTRPTNDAEARAMLYTEPINVSHTAYRQPVEMRFKRMLSQLRVGFYETVPGYSVKDLKFYATMDAAEAETDGRVRLTGDFPTEQEMTITYTNHETTPTAALNYVPRASESTLELGGLNYSTLVAGTNLEEGAYLETTSTPATCAKGQNDDAATYTYILPHVANSKPLSLKLDYTLVSNDGNGQEIPVKGIVASVPKEYVQWQNNYAYTYIFKITNSKLKPITFDAIAIAGDNGVTQGTITTLGMYNITTHQEGDVMDDDVVYERGKEIEVSTAVKNGLTTEKIALDGDADLVRIYHQKTLYETEIETETSTITTPSSEVYLETIERWENGIAYFVPDVTGTYRVEYWHRNDDGTEEKRAIKIVLVGINLGSKDHTGTDLKEETI